MTVHRIVGIDPGQTVGMAFLTWDTRAGWGSCSAQQLPWEQALQVMRAHPGAATLVAIEQWRLYASAAMAQVGSDMLTVEVIGRCKEIYRHIPMEQHPPSIKDPAWRFLESKGLDVPPMSQIHARDAAAQAAWSLRGVLHGRERKGR